MSFLYPLNLFVILVEYRTIWNKIAKNCGRRDGKHQEIASKTDFNAINIFPGKVLGVRQKMRRRIWRMQRMRKIWMMKMMMKRK